MGEQTAHGSFGHVCLISGWWTPSQTPLIDIVGVGSRNASLPLVACKVCENCVSPLLGPDLLLARRLDKSALVMVVDHLVASLSEMSVQRALGVEALKARGALVVVLLDGRHGVRWSM